MNKSTEDPSRLMSLLLEVNVKVSTDPKETSITTEVVPVVVTTLLLTKERVPLLNSKEKSNLSEKIELTIILKYILKLNLIYKITK